MGEEEDGSLTKDILDLTTEMAEAVEKGMKKGAEIIEKGVKKAANAIKKKP